MKRRQLSELIYRVRNGRWCLHCVAVPYKWGSATYLDTFTPWRIVDGMRKHRWCNECGRSEFA